MYYAYNCPYCSRLFFTYNNDKETASQVLYRGIKQHLIDYDEDKKEYEFDEAPQIENDQLYEAMRETTDAPPGGYETE